MDIGLPGIIVLYVAAALPYVLSAITIIFLVQDTLKKKIRKSTVILVGITTALFIVTVLFSGAV